MANNDSNDASLNQSDVSAETKEKANQVSCCEAEEQPLEGTAKSGNNAIDNILMSVVLVFALGLVYFVYSKRADMDDGQQNNVNYNYQVVEKTQASTPVGTAEGAEAAKK